VKGRCQWWTHLNEETILAYVLGRIPDADLPAVEDHLLLCERCATVFEVVQSIMLGLDMETADIVEQDASCTFVDGAMVTVKIRSVCLKRDHGSTRGPGVWVSQGAGQFDRTFLLPYS
jgi:hypothetical protein